MYTAPTPYQLSYSALSAPTAKVLHSKTAEKMGKSLLFGKIFCWYCYSSILFWPSAGLAMLL